MAITIQNLLSGEAGTRKGWETLERWDLGQEDEHIHPLGANRWGREQWDPADPPRASSCSAAIAAKFTRQQAPTKNKPRNKTKQVCSCTPQIVGSPSGAVMSCWNQAWFLRFAGRAEGEEVGGRARWQPRASHLLPWRFAGGQF